MSESEFRGLRGVGQMSESEKAEMRELRTTLRSINEIIVACNERINAAHSERDRARGEAAVVMNELRNLERAVEARTQAETVSGVV